MLAASRLLPGDCLFYGPGTFTGWMIALLSGSLVTHCEVYLGDGMVAGARGRGWGVGVYRFRQQRLKHVRRPPRPINMAAGMRWLAATYPSGFDFAALWWFLVRVPGWHSTQTDRQFCSEFVVRFYRACGVPVLPGRNPKTVNVSTLFASLDPISE